MCLPLWQTSELRRSRLQLHLNPLSPDPQLRVSFHRNHQPHLPTKANKKLSGIQPHNREAVKLHGLGSRSASWEGLISSLWIFKNDSNARSNGANV